MKLSLLWNFYFYGIYYNKYNPCNSISILCWLVTINSWWWNFLPLSYYHQSFVEIKNTIFQGFLLPIVNDSNLFWKNVVNIHHISYLIKHTFINNVLFLIDSPLHMQLEQWLLLPHSSQEAGSKQVCHRV